MLYTREQLNEMSKPYFEADEKLEMIIATVDGQFFYVASRGLAHSHVLRNKLSQPVEIRKKEVFPEPMEIEVDLSKKKKIIAKN